LEKENMVRALAYVKDLKEFLLKEEPELYNGNETDLREASIPAHFIEELLRTLDI
jgi:hypothetical protein